MSHFRTESQLPNRIVPSRDLMLRHHLLHPEINAVLGRAGHHATILIADGNYPASTTLGPRATLVSLNLSPGVVSCTQVLDALASAISIETARTMRPDRDGPYALPGEPPIWADYRTLLARHGCDVSLEPVEKWAFYEAVATPSHVLTIQTADAALWANLLLSVGVRKG